MIKRSYIIGNWLIYTVLIGLIPTFSKIIIFLTVNNEKFSSIFDPLDFVSLGLVLCVSIITEIQKYNKDRGWKIFSIGITIFLLVFYGILFSESYLSKKLPNTINDKSLTIITLAIAGINLIYAFSVFYKINLENKYV